MIIININHYFIKIFESYCNIFCLIAGYIHKKDRYDRINHNILI
jgi:hypothetical protein